ncbi:mycothiol conjugate amidase Mca [Brachybacterium timonense]|uniref:mycothiol conjugate amidase Mca n=1 Tax=Brachybacterium timonense TaxID=2050896 RepID=UPI000D0B71D0|nr:mycothiol conjugate amidase Mca [Brachybacterium timonense]
MTIQLPAPGEPLRMVAVHAHPDDESSKGAGTTARYVREGVHVTVITCTGGERGDILNPQLEGDEDLMKNLVDVRREEMARAQKVLGVDHEWLGFVDSGLPEGDPLPALPDGCFALKSVDDAARPLVEAVRRLRPHVLTTYDENGGYPHPDHIQCHRISLRAVDLAADPAFAPELGEPWSVLKVYYVNGFNRQRLDAIARYLREEGRANADLETWLERYDPRSDRLLTTRIDVRDYLEVRDAALRAHATQVDPDGFFFAIGHDDERAAWGTEDYELRMSRIGVTLPETDLFAGIRPLDSSADAETKRVGVGAKPVGAGASTRTQTREEER